MGHTARPVYQRRCLALGCEQMISPKRAFCSDHWFMIPRDVRVALANALESWHGAGEPTPEWRRACGQAIVAVAEREGRAVPEAYRQMAETGAAVGA